MTALIYASRAGAKSGQNRFLRAMDVAGFKCYRAFEWRMFLSANRYPLRRNMR